MDRGGFKRRPRVRGPGQEAGENGFTLLEVLVALAILGMSLSVLFAVFSQTLRQSRESQHQFEARNLATSLLHQALALPPDKLTDASGTTAQGLHWQVSLRDYGKPADKAAWTIRPVAIRIDVRWQGYPQEQSYALTSLRLMPKEHGG